MENKGNNYMILKYFDRVCGLTISKYILLLYLTTFSQGLCAQISDFQHNLTRYNVEFKMPKGYVMIDSSMQIIEGISGHVTAGSRIILKSLDKHMIIAIAFQGPIDTTKNLSIKMTKGQSYDPNKNYIPYNQRYILFPSEVSRKKFNADVAGSWDMTPFATMPILSKNEKCKVIFLHKDNLVDLEIYHYYQNLTSKELAYRLKKLDKMLQFKN